MRDVEPTFNMIYEIPAPYVSSAVTDGDQTQDLLSRLPAELILDIVGHLAAHPEHTPEEDEVALKSLQALSSTCRSFRQLRHEFLYAWYRAFRGTDLSFIPSIMARPRLAKRVKWIKLASSKYINTGQGYRYGSLERVSELTAYLQTLQLPYETQLLRCLTQQVIGCVENAILVHHSQNVTYIDTIHDHAGNHGNIPCALLPILQIAQRLPHGPQQPYSKLHTLKISMLSAAIGDVVLLMLLPSLRNFGIWDFEDDTEAKLGIQPNSSGVTHLELKNNSPYITSVATTLSETMSRMLNACKALRSFSVQQADLTSDWGIDLVISLRKHAGSLTTLKLDITKTDTSFSWYEDAIRSRDMEILPWDLNELHELRNLECPWSWLVGKSSGDRFVEEYFDYGMYHDMLFEQPYLPPSLETIHINVQGCELSDGAIDNQIRTFCSRIPNLRLLKVDYEHRNRSMDLFPTEFSNVSKELGSSGIQTDIQLYYQKECGFESITWFFMKLCVEKGLEVASQLCHAGGANTLAKLIKNDGEASTAEYEEEWLFWLAQYCDQTRFLRSMLQPRWM
ncbi:hypothetical protein B0J11DRAFT_618007 [Dendryphion nanum]|uniref:F-box domain-containing protein n=1 Tax=Dendryphion nanum TaxID=256645 RepID=A0A9P9DDF6_9PLEO|nr:hypothetical protein B0J11DRAFT_618007 [Dendryphion nanum]